jgi:hypothetical protein
MMLQQCHVRMCWLATLNLLFGLTLAYPEDNTSSCDVLCSYPEDVAYLLYIFL